MRGKMLALIVVCVFLFAGAFGQAMSGTYYIGNTGTAPGATDPHYATLNAACEAVMTAGVGGDIVFLITSDLTEPENVDLAVNTGDYSITFKPYTGITPTVTYTQAADNAGSSGAFVIGVLNTSGAALVPTNNIVIDGSNTVDGTTRDLSFVSSSGTNAYAFRLRGNNDNITIKNCNMTVTTASYGIWVNSVDNAIPDNLTIENNFIQANSTTTGTPVHVAYSGTITDPMENLVVRNNHLVARTRGVFLNGNTNVALIEGNTVEVNQTASGYISAAVFGNKIYSTGTTYILGNDFKVNATANTAASNGIRTIVASGGGTFIVANNFFRGYAGPDASGTATEMIGIRCGSPVEAYYNTFVLNNIDATTGTLYRAINVAAGTPTIKNNIFVIEEDDFSAYAISGAPVSDYNNFYLKGTTNAKAHPTYATLADLQGAGMDLNSVSKAVEFVSADDLHLAGASDGDFDLAGTPITGITTDIDGDVRGTEYPYMGADEAATALEAPVLPAVFFSEYIEGSSNNKALEIYNATGAAIDLADYRIAQASNGGGWAFYHTFPTGATLAAGNVWVIVASTVDPLLFNTDDADEALAYPAVVYHTGNDARGLEWTSDGGTTWHLVDIIGDPASSANFDVAGVAGAAAEHTLVRKNSVKTGNTDWAASAGTDADNSEWVVYDQNTFTFLGEHPSFPKVFFSEYIEGSSYNKALEIYNGTDETINLNDFAYPNASNGSDGTYEYWNTFTADATLAPGEVWVIADSRANAAILAVADQTNNFLSNGDDGFALAYIDGSDTLYIDWIGDFGPDIGDGWTVAGVANATKDHTLVRKTEVTKGNLWANSVGTNPDDSEWVVHPVDTFDFLGEHPTIPVVDEPGYYIPQGSHEKGFASLKLAIEHFDTTEITEQVVIILDADTLREEPLMFNATVANDILIKPAKERDVVLIVAPGSSAGYGTQMISFISGNVTIDGSNDGTDSRNLLITNEVYAAVPVGLNTSEADNVILKNLIIKNLDNDLNNFVYAVQTNDKPGIQNLVVENCQLGSEEFPIVKDAVGVWGSSTAPTQGIIINNEIYAGQRGITTYIVNDCVFEGNIINMIQVSSTTYIHGIYLTGASGPTKINNNKIFAIETAINPSAYVMGIAFAGNAEGEGSIISVENNMINIGAALGTNAVYGIGLRSSQNMGNIEVHHNTIVMNETASTLASYGIGNHTNGTGSVTVDLKNNIIVNNHTGNTGSSAIGLIPTTSVLTSDNNVLLSSQNLVNFKGTLYADLAAWQSTGQDAGSVSKAVTFASATDLHLADPSDKDLDLVMPLIPDVLTDIDGDARGHGDGLDLTYAGADEGTVFPTMNIVEDFATAADVANWRSDNSGYTVRTQVDGMLRLSDGGWTFDARRNVSATPNTFFKATAKIMTVGSFSANPANQYLNFGIDGLGDRVYQVSCISDSVFTTFSVIGYAVNETGTLFIAGQGGSGADTVWVDEYTYTNNYVPGLDVISTVAEARAVPVGQKLATIGVATTTTHFGTSGPVYIQDGTAGYAVYHYATAQNVEIGDEIMAIGTQKNYNGLLELDPTLDFIVLSKGNAVEPVEIVAADMDGEAYEGQLVMIRGVDTLATGLSWPAAGSNMGVNLKDKAGTEFYAYLDKDTDIDGSPKPDTWPLNLVGIVSDYNGAQLMPRSLADFILVNPPGDFHWLKPANNTVITSLDDPDIVDFVMGSDTIKALYLEWTKAVDPDAGDTVTYEFFAYPNGPEEKLTTLDTFMFIPINMEKPYDMNGTYNAYITASDLSDEVTYSDTIVLTFDFPAPPVVVSSDIVLVDGTPKFYAQFSMPITPAIANFKFVDWSDGGSVSAATAIDGMTDYVLISGNLLEDHWYSLAYSGVVSAADTSGDPLTVVDTTMGYKVLIPASADHPEDVAKIITPFEDNVGSFVHPTYSGSTTGLLTTSSFAVSDEAAYRGSKSGKLTLLDDPDVSGGWYLRLLYGYPFTYSVKTSSTIMFLVKGTNANVEMRLSVKDTGYEQSPWKRVTLSENDWQVVSFDLANDPAEGWVNGNGIVEGETVVIEGIHMRCPEDADVVLYIDDFIERPVLSPVDVTLNVIMKKWHADGKFNLALDWVDVAGTFNSWSGTMMADTDGDTTYSVTLPLMPYSSHEFKFRINSSWDDATAEFPYGAPGRQLTVGTTASEHTYWYNNDTLEVSAPGVPKEFALHQNYPNPFNPTTTINFDLPTNADVKLVIYDITGRKVRTLVNGHIDAGYKKIVWNGRDDWGNGVATGMYIYRLIAGDFVDVKKMTFLK